MPRPKRIFNEYGVSGLKRFGGTISEEYIADLRGEQGRKTLRRMSMTDPTIGAMLFVIKQLTKAADWETRTHPMDESKDGEEAAEFVDGVLNDMSRSWASTVSSICSMYEFGFDLREICYKQRLGRDAKYPSAYDDGRIGIRKLAVRSQCTINEWAFDKSGGIKGAWQEDPDSRKRIFLPIEKCLLFRTEEDNDNPEGRALPLDTKIPTPGGWSTIGDLCVGDKLYGSDGEIIAVIEKSPVFTDRPIYRVSLSAGAEIDADENHLWSVTTNNDRSNNKDARLMTTRQIYDEIIEKDESGKTSSFYSTGIVPVVKGVKTSLPVNPYVLGYWLGDGTVGTGVFAVHKDDSEDLIYNLGRAGYSASFDGDRKVSSIGLSMDLKAAGVFNKKMIPGSYLRAEAKDRIALLQGLMDSDGTSSTGKDHASRFYNTNTDLVDGFAELVRSLGCRPHIRISQEAGKICGNINGKDIISRKNLYGVSFFTDIQCHRLPRKDKEQSKSRSNRTNGYYIQGIEKIGEADTVCIQVDADDGLFLAGDHFVTTHNSVISNAYTAWYFLRNYRELEGIGVEKDVTGTMIVKLAADMFTDSANATKLQEWKNLVSNYRNDELDGILLPHDPNNPDLFDVSLLASPGEKMYDIAKIIDRLKAEIAQVCLTDFILLGHEGVGSFALARSKQDALGIAVSCWLDLIASVINTHLIPKLMKLNPEFSGLQYYPQVVPRMAKVPSYEEISSLVRSLAFASFHISSNQSILNSILDSYGLPKVGDEEFENLMENAVDGKVEPTAGLLDGYPSEIELAQEVSDEGAVEDDKMFDDDEAKTGPTGA